MWPVNLRKSFPSCFFEKVVSILFSGDEIEDYNKLIKLSGECSAQEMIKQILHEKLK